MLLQVSKAGANVSFIPSLTGAPTATVTQPKPAPEPKKKAAKADPLADPDVEKRLVKQWDELPQQVRDEIAAEVNRQHSGLLRWPAMMLPLYLEEMARRFGTTTHNEKSSQ